MSGLKKLAPLLKQSRMKIVTSSKGWVSVMRKRIVQSLAVSFLSLAFSSTSFSFDFYNDLFEEIRPYAGVDYQGRHFGFENAFGGNIFKNEFTQYNVYGGLRFCDWFSLNIGFESTPHKHRTITLSEGESYLGLSVLTPPGSETHYTETKIRGTYLELMGFAPICPRYDLELFASAGIVRNKLSLTDIQTAQSGISLEAPITKTYSVKHTNGRASLGLQKIFYEHFGIRALIATENTNRFRNLKPLESPSADTRVKAKESVIYGLGIFVTA